MENVHMEYYSAVWCAPCKMMVGPIAELQAEGWSIEKIDVDKEKARASTVGVFAIPTFIVYRNGEQVRRFSGARTKAGIEGELKLASS